MLATELSAYITGTYQENTNSAPEVTLAGLILKKIKSLFQEFTNKQKVASQSTSTQAIANPDASKDTPATSQKISTPLRKGLDHIATMSRDQQISTLENEIEVIKKTIQEMQEKLTNQRHPLTAAEKLKLEDQIERNKLIELNSRKQVLDTLKN
ncbi:MAG TPA: hypothetical protein DCE71_02815 [Parachlamydiales bacterium]|nr:hypothetical protein [Parachlamydiales bacterium]